MRTALVIAWFLVLAPAAWAQSDDDDSAAEGDDDDSADADEPDDGTPAVSETLVVTATGEPRLLSEAPLPVRVIDEETIRRSGAADAADLLKRAPGIPVMSQGIDNRGGVSGISLQGIPAGRTLILLDGRPVSGDVGGIVDLSQFPADILERVEIVEGPMSALYGSDALGGVVNLITRKPPPGTRISGRVQGSSDPSVDLGLTLSSAQADGLQWGSTVTGKLAAAIDLDTDDLATDLDDRKAVSWRFFAALRRERNRLEISTLYAHDARDGVLLRRNNAIDHIAVYDARKRHDRFDANFSWLHRYPGLGSTRLEVDVTDYAFAFDEDLRASDVRSIRRARTTAGAGRFRFDLRYVPWGSLAAGVEGRIEGLRVFQDRSEATGGQVRLEEVAPTVEGAVEPWVQADLRLFGGRLEVVPGIRLSIHDSYGFAPAPSIAIRVDLWKNASLRLSGGRGYRAPSLKDRHLVFDHAALGYIVYGDPDLRPESSWGANLSLEQRIANRATIRVGGYANRLLDLITYVYDGASSTDGLNVYRSTNVEGARTFGAQATAEVRYPWIVATVAYRFLWALADDGFFLPDSSVHGLRGTIELTLAKIDLSLYNSVAWESERFVDTSQQLRSPGLVRWDIRLEKRFTGRHEMAVFVGVDNVLNQRRDPAVEGDFRPVEGRRVLAGVRGALRFEPAH
ncbi:MAG: TonB-dependent receptor [Proteobacteria bacterium]|nr:TonB-dependent receptor [Pseudomonadota bacterium]